MTASYAIYSRDLGVLMGVVEGEVKLTPSPATIIVDLRESGLTAEQVQANEADVLARHYEREHLRASHGWTCGCPDCLAPLFVEPHVCTSCAGSIGIDCRCE